MRKQNNLIKQINKGIEMCFFGKEQKIKSEMKERQNHAKELYDYLDKELRDEGAWTKKWIKREYTLLDENFTPEKILERAIGIYDFMRNPIQNQIKKYQWENQ